MSHTTTHIKHKSRALHFARRLSLRRSRSTEQLRCTTVSLQNQSVSRRSSIISPNAPTSSSSTLEIWPTVTKPRLCPLRLCVVFAHAAHVAIKFN